MRPLGIAFALFVVGSLSGCSGAPAVTAAESAPQPQSSNQGRFQLASGAAYGLALDTKTGLLCHTYDLVDSEKHIPQCVELLVHEKDVIGKQMADGSGKPFDWDDYPVAK